MRTDANSSDVHAMESSPYKVKDDKVLLCQGRVVVVVGSSFIWAPGSRPKSVIPSRTRGARDMIVRSVMALRVTLILMSRQWFGMPHFLKYDSLTASLLVWRGGGLHPAFRAKDL